ncbi:MAG: DNA-binding domain-containing protein [Burkholderiales bacterium]|jgi:hypothetical protein|nr:DNA-binding domain-containing protein [Burkholderiales bacterium]
MKAAAMRTDPNAPSASLREFQRGFAQALVAIDPSSGASPEIATLARQPGFAVYRNTVMKGCIDALQANYPAVARLVGEEWFRAAAAIYVRANLPRRPMLADYGEGFADFLAAFEPAAELPYLAGVACLDRFWTEAHLARDEEPLSGASIATRSPDELARTVLRPHAAARWAWFESAPIFSLWRRNRELADDLSDVEWQSEGALLVRPRDSVRWMSLGRGGCAFLGACAAGETLGSAAAAALAADPDIDLSIFIATVLEAGAFAAVADADSNQEES